MNVIRLLLLASLAHLSGCYFLQDATVPMESIAHPNESGNAKQLLVLLPGIGDSHKSFEKNGVVETTLKQCEDVDVLAVNAHLAYYQERSLIPRLYEDIIQPAQEQGYESIHIAGISLGGFGALKYYESHANTVDKLLLFAPFLGEYEDYGYLLDNSMQPSESDRNSWPWFVANKEALKPAVYLAFGWDDKFAKPNRLFADTLNLPNEQVTSMAGGHKWKVWKELWPKQLQKALGCE